MRVDRLISRGTIGMGGQKTGLRTHSEGSLNLNFQRKIAIDRYYMEYCYEAKNWPMDMYIL